jgi:mannose-6-phosphate isomerase-like protein (cupin superfamily)
MRFALPALLVFSGALLVQDRTVEPTWLRRDLSTAREQKTDLTTGSCRYLPLFGEGDTESRYPLSVARFGQLTIAPGGECQAVSYPRQEEIYFVRSGRGTLDFAGQTHPLVANDFAYLPPGVAHAISNHSAEPLRIVLTTVKIPARVAISQPTKLEIANLGELKQQTVGGHPSSVLYQLMIGPHNRTRDRINAAYNVVDFFLMDFAPAGTNFPHHHEIAEEIYLVLDGEGQMAAGSGADGVEGLYAAKADDAYYFRPNATVGFYNRNAAEAKAHILALRVYVPLPKSDD